MIAQASPDESGFPAAAVNATADTAMYRSLMRKMIPGIVLTRLLSTVNFALYVTMVFMACLAVGGLTAGPRELALACLALIAATVLVSSYRDAQELRAALDQPQDPALPADWKEAAAELDSRRAWRGRALTAPLALLLSIRLTQSGLVIHHAAFSAFAVWLAPDLIRLFKASARIRLHPIASMLEPPGAGTPQSQKP
ncbi:hypothetical protein L3Q67_02305 [Saccharothrix sp. AJ9571]|nr:hypothetical protein L3Q67_02305 [Saccharothrix sp. AJ9571]